MAADRLGSRGRSDYAYALAGELAALVLATLATIFMTRAAGVRGRGVLSTVVTVSTYGAMLAHFGFQNGIVRFVARASGPTLQQLRVVIGRAFAGFAPLSAVGSVLVVFWLLRGDLTERELWVAVIAAGQAPLLLYGSFAQAYLRGRGWHAEIAAADIVSNGIRLGLSAVAFIAGMPLWQLLAINFVAAMAQAGAVYVVSRRRAFRLALRGSTGHLSGPMIRFGLVAHAGNVLVGLNYRLDVILVVSMAGIEEAGLYSVAIVISEILLVPAKAIGNVVSQRSAMVAKGEMGVSGQALLAVGAATLAGSVAIAALAAPVLMLLFGPEFGAARTPLLLLLPGVVALGVQQVAIRDLVGRGRPAAKSIAAVAGLAVTIMPGLWLIREYGASGAAAASTLAYTTMTIVAVRLLVRELGLGPLTLVRSSWRAGWGPVRSLLPWSRLNAG